VFGDGVVEIYGNTKVFVEQIAFMLDGIVGLVSDDKVIAIGEPRSDGVFAAASYESEERTEEQKYMFHGDGA